MRKAITSLGILIAVLLLTGCNDALVYGESTNFSLATIKVNSDVAEPISINAGLNRTVGATSPPNTRAKAKAKAKAKAGAEAQSGEAMNMVSRFELDNQQTLKDPFGALTIRTEFASGKAATNMVNFNHVAAMKMMNLSYVQPLNKEAIALRGKLISHIRGTGDQEVLKLIAQDMAVEHTADPKTQIIKALNKASSAQLTGYKTTIESRLGVN